MGKEVFDMKAREVFSEGVVMLENRGGALPLPAGSRVALFGCAQFEKAVYQLDEELTAFYRDNCGQTDGGKNEEEIVPLMEMTERLAARNDAAIVFLEREPTPQEEELLCVICSSFDRTIVLLATGGIIDMDWMDRCCPDAVLYIWQEDKAAGPGVMDVLTGAVSPSGRLPDTIAKECADRPDLKEIECFNNNEDNTAAFRLNEYIYTGYRWYETFAGERVRYPFGFGLSYTSFSLQVRSMSMEDSGGIVFRMEVTNTGTVPGKEVVQMYCEAPQGALGKPARVLCGYRKTPVLAPGKTRAIKIIVQPSSIASFDGGAAGSGPAWVLEAGKYSFYAGANVRDAVFAGSIDLGGTAVIEQVGRAEVPETLSAVGTPTEVPEMLPAAGAPAKVPPRAIPNDIQLEDVARGKAGMDAFLSGRTEEDLQEILDRDGICRLQKRAPGLYAFGGLTPQLKRLGVPEAFCGEGDVQGSPGGRTDGKTDIKTDIKTCAFALPMSTLLAATWNNNLVRDLYACKGRALRSAGIDVIPGPSVNIHIDPACAENSGSFSEDPYLTGKMAAAALWGLHENGVEGAVRFGGAGGSIPAGSERALREIYLKGLEMAIKDGGATAVMMPSGPADGQSGNSMSYHDIRRKILEEQWGFKGIVLPGTDQDVLTGSEQDSSFGTDKDTLMRDAGRLFRFLIDAPAFLRLLGMEESKGTNE